MTEDFTPGLKIKFTKPILDQPDEKFTPYTTLADNPRSIISEGIVRLVEGLALQPAPMEVVVRSGQEQIFNFTHSTTPFSHIQPDLNIPVVLFEVTNRLTYAENVEHTISVPTKLIGVDVAQLYDRAIQKHDNSENDNTEEPDDSEPPVLEEVWLAYSEIVDAILKELRNHNTSFAGPILREHAKSTSLEWDSAENKKNAAREEAKKIKSICLIDISEKQ